MNIQIFGKAKCFDTKKAQRWFKERRIRVQEIDLGKYPMSKGEMQRVCAAVGLEKLIDTENREYAASMLPYLSGVDSKMAYLLENQHLIKTPVVRDGKRATVGYCPDVWKDWQ